MLARNQRLLLLVQNQNLKRKSKPLRIYVCLFLKDMSANELEELMSQLHADSKMQLGTHDLGLKIGPDGNKLVESYRGEIKYTRNGRVRGKYDTKLGKFVEKPLDLEKIKINRNYKRKYYVPKHEGVILVDEDGKELHFPYLVTDSKGQVKWENIQMTDEWKALFWAERYKAKALMNKYSSAKKYIEMLKGIVKGMDVKDNSVVANANSAKGKPSHTQVHTSHGAAIGGGSEAKGGRPAPLPVTGGQSAPRAAQIRYKAPQIRDMKSAPSTTERKADPRGSEKYDVFHSKQPKRGNPANFLRDDPARGAPVMRGE
jgi:hypothetical protein